MWYAAVALHCAYMSPYLLLTLCLTTYHLLFHLCMLQVLGVPTLESWPGLADLPHRIDFKPAAGQPLEQVFPQVGCRLFGGRTAVWTVGVAA